MSASPSSALSHAARSFWPTPEATRLRARELFAPGTMLPVALDLARGVAALLVLGYHLRTWLMAPYAEATPHGPMLLALYLVTSFGHEAVLVFFVLSGFLIGGAVLRMDFAAPGAVAGYVAARLARIGPVLVGAVAVAILLRAATAPWTAAPECRDTLVTITGNLLALGNLGVPVLCNDLPLWSLSNEVAYYIAFPTLVALARGHRSPGVIAACGVVLAICAASLAFTPLDYQNVVLYFPAWLAGAALWWLPGRRIWPAWPGLIGFAVALLISRIPGADRFFVLRDLLTTLAFAALLAGLVGRCWPREGLVARIVGPFTAIASGTAAISFSLYVTHNPVLDAAMRWEAHRGTPVPMASVSWSLLVALYGACLGVALIFSQVFERPHREIARWLGRLLTPRPDPRPARASH